MSLDDRVVVGEVNLTRESVRRVVESCGGVAPQVIFTGCYVCWDGEELEWVHRLVGYRGSRPLYSTGLYNSKEEDEE